MDILRFITAGNIDDGKSTLTGRILYDTHSIKTDVLESVSAVSDNGANVNLAHIADGLRAEREQGITVDVAYKYFTTPTRKYIITDAPGHFQYTKNLVTGASGVDAMIILIDAKNGITEQTRRHSLVASFLKIPQVVIAVNKMDLVGYDERVFTSIKNEYLQIAGKLNLAGLTFIPISAFYGDNVFAPSENMEWYNGQTLMQYLESCEPVMEHSGITRFSVQYIIETGKEGFENGYAGKMLSGGLKAGDSIAAYPGGDMATVRKILHGYKEVTEAYSGENITVYFQNNVKTKRGSICACPHNAPHCISEFEATVCWLNSAAPLQTGAEYLLRINGTETICKITEMVYKIDNNSFGNNLDDKTVEVNEFAVIRIETKDVIAFDTFLLLPENGRGIIIDAETNYTSGAFTINAQ